MSLWVGCVGKIKIKEEYSKDLELFLQEKYTELSTDLFQKFVRFEIWDEYNKPSWKSSNWREEWHGKYKTGYDKTTRIFQYRNELNWHNNSKRVSWIVFLDLLDKIAEEIIYKDICDEDMLMEIGDNPYFDIEE